MCTGGLVNIIRTSATSAAPLYRRDLSEFIDRLDKQDAAFHPDKLDWGSTDESVLKYYRRLPPFLRAENKDGKDALLYSAIIDPEIRKNEINRMVTEAGVKLYLHSWVTNTIMEGNKVKGIIFEQIRPAGGARQNHRLHRRR